MGGEPDSAPPRAGARLAGVSLLHAVFSEREAPEPPDRQAPEHARFFLDLRVERTAALRLRATLELSGESGLPYDLHVAYAAEFEMDESCPAERRDTEWRDAGFRRAPLILFPYIRELVAGLTARWGDAPLLLPDDPDLLDFTRDAYDLPPPPAAS